jgi:DNA-binding winged helix-turn-helix (wHTH) protein
MNTTAKPNVAPLTRPNGHGADGSISSDHNAAPEDRALARRIPTRYARFGAFQLDTHRQDLLKHGVRLRLPGKVCQVLITLLERPGEIVTREELRARLWPSDTHVNFDANVNTTVNKLRQILGGPAGSTANYGEDSMYVQTIPRKGYSFISKVEFIDQPESAAPDEEPADPAQIAADGATAIIPATGSKLFAPQRSRVWFAAGVIALVLAAILFGAAITLFSSRPF